MLIEKLMTGPQLSHNNEVGIVFGNLLMTVYGCMGKKVLLPTFSVRGNDFRASPL